MKLDTKVLLENKSKFLLVHSSSGHKQVLKEILSDPAVASRLADTKVCQVDHCKPGVCFWFKMDTQIILWIHGVISCPLNQTP